MGEAGFNLRTGNLLNSSFYLSNYGCLVKLQLLACVSPVCVQCLQSVPPDRAGWVGRFMSLSGRVGAAHWKAALGTSCSHLEVSPGADSRVEIADS